MAVVVVVGAGMMGTALCTPISDAGNEVRLVGTHLDDPWIKAMKDTGQHPKLGIALPDRVKPFFLSEIDQAFAGAEMTGVGVSSAGVGWAAKAIGPFVKKAMPLIAVTKGLARGGDRVLRVLPEVFADHLDESVRALVSPAAIGGPCIAGEIARRVPTAVVFTGRDRAALDRMAAAFQTDYYHVRVSTDVVGVEACAALKNAYAMAVGIGVGVHERLGGIRSPVAHHNYEAAVFAQASLEMHLLVKALGGDPAQVPHLAGVGDLFVTCSGGRSSRLGRLLGMGMSFDQARSEMAGDTLESADTVRVVGDAIGQLEAAGLVPKASLPLMQHLHHVIVAGGCLDMPFDAFFR